MNAATEWVHAVLHAAVGRLVDTGSGPTGASLTSASIADYLEDRAARTAVPTSMEVEAASNTLAEALAEASTSTEPLAVAARSLALTTLEFRAMVLALGPELDPRHQRWVSLLMEEVGRRVGTLGLYAELLGEPSHVSRELSQTGNLARWRLFEGHAKGTPAADEPLRLDPPFRAWLVGADDLMEHDPVLRRIVRATRWPGAGLIDRERERAAHLVRQLQDRAGRHWIVVDTNSPTTLVALVEAGADDCDLEIIRIDATSLRDLDRDESRDCGLRVARLSRLLGKPIVIEASGADDVREHIEATRTFLLAIGSVGCQGAIITAGPAHIVGKPQEGTRTGPWPTTMKGYREIYDAGLTIATDRWVQMRIISEKLGGSGTDFNNLIPAPGSVNTGPFRSWEHATVSLASGKSGGIKNRVWVEVMITGTKSAATSIAGKSGLYFWKGKNASPKWVQNKTPSLMATAGIPKPQLKSGARKLVLNFTSSTEMQSDFGISSSTAKLVKEGRPYSSRQHFLTDMGKRGATSGQIAAVLSKGPVLNGP